MGIIDRSLEILKANVNELLDKAEDPAKMIDQYTRDLTKALAEVKEETAGVMAEEQRAKRVVEENQKEIEKYAASAKKALEAGNEGDARTLIEKKQQLEAAGANLRASYEVAVANAAKMREMHDKLVSDIEILKSRKESIKAKVAVAKTQQKVNEFESGTKKAATAMAAFDRMEEKAEGMIDKAEAISELGEVVVSTEAEDIIRKYESTVSDASVEAELAELKKALGQ